MSPIFDKNLSFPCFRGFSGFFRLWQKSAFRKFLAFWGLCRLSLPGIRAFWRRRRMPDAPLKSLPLYDSSFGIVTNFVTGVNFCQCLLLPGIRAFSGFPLKEGVKKCHFLWVVKSVFARY